MKGIDNITKRIADDANRKADEILSAARREAEAIEAEFSSKASAECEAILARGRENAAERERRLAGMSELEAKKNKLAKKQDMISAAFDCAEEKLKNLPANELADILARLALSAASGSCGEIILSEKDRSELGEEILKRTSQNEKITLSDETRELGGGLVLKNGSTETNCTFKSIVNSLRDELALDVAEILFG